ncbi:gamma-aminobutyric acid receptor subunit alpha-5-like [Harpegnathos saltator]|nr:gamma-aminobutyric acid receptor subunit alpha-5-like [Harpegnathos saltator]
MERQTQTELILPLWRQFLYCLAGDDAFRRRRQREAASSYRKYGDRLSRHINSVSYIDRVARIVFPASFGLLNVCYWVVYVTYQEEFKWQDPPIGSISH